MKSRLFFISLAVLLLLFATGFSLKAGEIFSGDFSSACDVQPSSFFWCNNYSSSSITLDKEEKKNEDEEEVTSDEERDYKKVPDYRLDPPFFNEAFRILMKRYVNEIDGKVLFQGAIKELKKVLKEYNVPSDELGDLDFDKTFMSEVVDRYESKVNPKILVYAAINGMCDSLNDPYTLYFTPDEEKALDMELKGPKTTGVGCLIDILDKEDNNVVVYDVLEDSPAAKAGIHAGDIISKINGKSVSGLSMNDIKKMIKGPVGTGITITVKRAPNYEELEYKLKIETIKRKTLSYKILPGKIGYIKLRIFGEDTGKEIAEAMKKFNASNVKAYILDLRNNGGGYLEAAIGVGTQFLPSRSILVTMEGENYSQKVYRTEENINPILPMVVLVNGYTASASEVTAGAIQDRKLGVIIGTKTFGKGLVQTSVDLGDSGAIHVTIAHYYTPSGRDIHKVGIKPDIEVKLDPRLARADEEDTQFQKALEYLKDKI